MTLRFANILLSVVLIALAVYVFVESRSFSARAAELPVLLAIMLFVLAVVLGAVNLNPRSGALRSDQHPFDGVPWKSWLAVVVLLLLFGAGAMTVGFYESALVFLAVTTWLLAAGQSPGRRLVSALTFAIVFDVALYGIFKLLLQIPTPPGVFA